MDRRSAWVLGIIFGGLFLCLFGFLLLLFMMVRSDGRTTLVSGDRVGVVEVTGPITDSKKVLKELDDFREQDNVKSVVVRIDSPGGSVGASQEIYDAIKQSRKPVPGADAGRATLLSGRPFRRPQTIHRRGGGGARPLGRRGEAIRRWPSLHRPAGQGMEAGGFAWRFRRGGAGGREAGGD